MALDPEATGTDDLDRARRHRTARRVADLITAVAAGFVVFLLLNPASGTGAEPACTSAFGFGVPCGTTLAGVAAGTTTFVVGVVLIWAADRRQRRADRARRRPSADRRGPAPFAPDRP